MQGKELFGHGSAIHVPVIRISANNDSLPAQGLYRASVKLWGCQMIRYFMSVCFLVHPTACLSD